MPSKTEFYRQMADHVATQLTGSWQEWAGFLTTAARLYKYPFHEQLLIYAQRPDATACAEYDLWNEKWAAMCAVAPRVSPWWTIPVTGPGCAMCLTFLTPGPANIPALPGCGRWRKRIRSLCRPCWSTLTRLAAITLPSSWRRWLTSWQANTGTSIARTCSISLTIPF